MQFNLPGKQVREELQLGVLVASGGAPRGLQTPASRITREIFKKKKGGGEVEFRFDQRYAYAASLRPSRSSRDLRDHDPHTPQPLFSLQQSTSEGTVAPGGWRDWTRGKQQAPIHTLYNCQGGFALKREKSAKKFDTRYRNLYARNPGQSSLGSSSGFG